MHAKMKGIFYSLAMAALTSMAFAGGDSMAVAQVAYKDGGFIGVEGSYVFQIQSDIDYINGQPFVENYDGNGGSFGIRLGAQEKAWRAMLGYEYFDNNDDQNYERAFLQLDFFPMYDPEAVGFVLRPYLGLNVGWINYETTGTEDKDGLAYGGQAGVAMMLSDNVDLDLGIRYILTSMDEVDHIGTVTVGLHYMY